jgi:hypothetical protein
VTARRSRTISLMRGSGGIANAEPRQHSQQSHWAFGLMSLSRTPQKLRSKGSVPDLR